MLGQFGQYPWYTRIDLRGSKTFLSKVRRQTPSLSKSENGGPGGRIRLGVDCGAGVGRVTEGFLRDVCEVVDAVEPVEKFAGVIRERKEEKDQGSNGQGKGKGKEGTCGEGTGRGEIGDIFLTGLEAWIPSKKYDLIWAQFCCNYVTDAQLAEFLKRSCAALTETGIVVLKENITTDPKGEDLYDPEDSSVTRSDQKFRALCKEAGLGVIASELQLGYPKSFNLLPVRFYALRPIS